MENYLGVKRNRFHNGLKQKDEDCQWLFEHTYIGPYYLWRSLWKIKLSSKYVSWWISIFMWKKALTIKLFILKTKNSCQIHFVNLRKHMLKLKKLHSIYEKIYWYKWFWYSSFYIHAISSSSIFWNTAADLTALQVNLQIRHKN